MDCLKEVRLSLAYTLLLSKPMPSLLFLLYTGFEVD